MVPAHPTRTSSRGLLLWSFGGIGALFALIAIAVVAWSQVAGNESRRIAADMLMSIEVVSRIGRDVDQERILVNEHIAEQDDARMRALEPKSARPKQISARRWEATFP
jgi:hypothetical protein